MNSNNFIEIKINMEHVFLSHLPAHAFSPKHLGVHLPRSPVLSTAQDLMEYGTQNL